MFQPQKYSKKIICFMFQMICVPAFLTFCYAVIMLVYLGGFLRARLHPVRRLSAPGLRVAVVIPARNEAAVIRNCILSVLNGSYHPDLIELVVVDDFSTDETVTVVSDLYASMHENMSVKRLISLAGYLPPERSGFPNKKKALELAVAAVSADIIVTTDADCVVPHNWLNIIVAQFISNSDLQILASPVLCSSGDSLIQRYQALDFIGLMGITAAGYELGWHQMGNGANLAYRKSAFQAVNGYEGNDHIPSGDDMFLLGKISERWPGSARFLLSRDAVVTTLPRPDWRSFIRQRIRWGSKNSAIPGVAVKLILLSVLLFCMGIWISLIAALAGFIPWQVFLVQVAVKFLFDYILMSSAASFFGRRELLRYFPVMSLVHTAQITVAGAGSLLPGRSKW
jgi:cellulose synthase/poly-beta-1,6-N-acetylglucosamine synthase-like glycosyltransferase